MIYFVIFYLFSIAKSQNRFRGLSEVDIALYQAIEVSRDKGFFFFFLLCVIYLNIYYLGIWVRDLCNKTGVSQTPARKSLKTLEARKLIKEVKVSTVCYFFSFFLFYF